MKYLQLSINLTPSLVRHDTMKDEKYLVVPMVMMVEGVHNGSSGALYYPEEELSQIPEVWNTKPVVVYHPEANGKGVSACSPEVLSKYSIGSIMNAKWDSKQKRLTAEAWLEESRIAKVDNRVGEAIEKGEMMELSTGLFLELEQEEGEWEGPGGAEKYVAIARNYKPDHLAVLPDKIGACSLADGAGFLRNELKTEAQKDKPDFNAVIIDFLTRRGFIDNELSYQGITRQLHGELRRHLGLLEDEYAFIEDVYSNFFIYEYEGKLYRLSYSTEADVITVEGDPQEVVRVSEYRTVDGSFVGNNRPSESTIIQNHNIMNKEELIKALLEGPVYNEGQKEWLSSLEVDVLTQLKESADRVVNEMEKAPVKKPASEGSSTPAPEANSLEEFIAKAPEGIRDTLTTMQSRMEREKATLVERISNHKLNRFSSEQLKSKSVEELENLAAFCEDQKPQARFDGQGDPGPSFNSEGRQPLVAPSLSD